MHKAAAMTLSHHYHAVCTLSPMAARMAARLLDGSMNIPVEWRLSLRLALAERGRFAGPMAINGMWPALGMDKNSRAAGGADTEPLDADARPQWQARRFIRAVQGDWGAATQP